MSDDADEEEDAPAVELGERTPVEGAPLARVASRLEWPIQKSEIVRKEGEVTIRTPEGPQELGDVLDDVETTYFSRRQDFVADVEDVVGTGPVQTS
ncbi:hypothetical protein SAMN06269185_2017 [Natronoarchaeum philippinense]|uniref:Uncharacterized protein n=1 Tax=Natronoarchaeum philippinense TaxID=558529 RepID=A0A285NU47_NATPI|nr:DUF5789 family protein [Natronoarchaeum philippinense]SNZ13024.1 hypothetical protein SAMN06269185_2017 [Natronoarchaeum philippinense]